VVDLELADEVEVSPPKKRRGAMRSKCSAKNDATGKRAQILNGVHATGKDVGGEDAQVTDHRESYEGFAKAASHPMNSDSEQTIHDGGSANKRSQKIATSKSTLNESGRAVRSTWEYCLSELADYRKIHGHCNVPKGYSKKTSWLCGSQTKGLAIGCT
jgi:hypothetical protein